MTECTCILLAVGAVEIIIDDDDAEHHDGSNIIERLHSSDR